MKGVALCLMPPKEGSDLLSVSYTEVQGDTKHTIKVRSANTFQVVDGWRQKMHEKIIDYMAAENVVPVVFGAHQDLGLTDQELTECAIRNLPEGTPFTPRKYYPEMSDIRTPVANILQPKENLQGNDINYLEQLAAAFAPNFCQKQGVLFIRLHDANHPVNEVIQSGGIWKKTFGEILCQKIVPPRNVCVKGPGSISNPPFTDVTTALMARILDQKTGDAPCLVEALPL